MNVRPGSGFSGVVVRGSAGNVPQRRQRVARGLSGTGTESVNRATRGVPTYCLKPWCAGPFGRGMHILVADDELTSRTVLSALVRKAGHTPVVVADGAEAWERHRAEPFAIVVTDWLMPNMSGIDLTRVIREAAAGGEVTAAEGYTFVLVVTSLSAREKALEAFEAGVDDLLVKPIDTEQIAARLAAAERIIRGHARTRETSMRNAVEELQSAVGADDPRLVKTIDALVTLYRSQDAYAKARAFLRREIDIIVRARGAEDPHAVRLRTELAELQPVGGPAPTAAEES